MKTKPALLLAISAMTGTLLAFVVHGCNGDAGTSFPCGPDFPCVYADSLCIEGVCYRPDAGPDANDASTSSAIGCAGPCIPPPPDDWDLRALWHGPSTEAPTRCPALGADGEEAFPVFLGHADVSAPPANCDPCKCTEPTGACTTLPETIEIRSAICDAAGTSLPFGGPEGWDGSCTDAHALAAGAMCGSALCAQSIVVSPLGPPVGEACEPFAEPLPVAHYGLPEPTWKTSAIGCLIPTCNATSLSCLPSIRPMPDAFHTCVKRTGEHTCPTGWDKGKRFVVYEVTNERQGWIEGRACTACACGAAGGGGCLARVRTFEDGACSKLLSDDPIASFGEQCTNVFPTGLPIGSKEITPPAYLPGACEPSGGAPSGDVQEDPEQAVTFCCRPPDT
ncbi:hypothetical protein [Polyangium fumosum]|uniref:Uncharacterized protein n=1 Tax=Polyangium fumosum TaxID=889272 RepID=A0A4U1J2X0_9BACT|nr:hypothetical protein [Polyangium fumosum]TKD01381.1 hypothetical protein E8A74_31560 [Polyangium fumosum]